MDARAILRDPTRRALYLATGQTELPEQGGPDVGADFLERMFELQMSARMGDDSVAAQVESLDADNLEQISIVMRRFDDSGEGLDQIPSLIARQRYLRTARKLVSPAPE
jgi:hypothetical protein